MKNLYIILFILPLIVFSQIEEKLLLEQLHEMVTEDNKLLPLDGGEVVWEKVTLDGGFYTYHYIIKEKNHLSLINGYYNFSYIFDHYKKYHVIDSDYTTNSDDALYDWTNHSVQQISSLLYLFKNKLNMTLGLDIINEKGESFDIIVDGETLLESELGEIINKFIVFD